jgi:hypothetical protein
MKRLMLATALSITAVVIAPVTSASAEKASGTCTFSGTATFLTKNLKVIPTPNLGYEFEGSAKCEVLPSREIREGTLRAEGAETLSCSGSLGEAEGKGNLTFGELKLPFSLRFFLGSPGSTAFAATFADGSVALGTATFLTSKSEEPSECFMLKGAHLLHFIGAAVGEL